MWADHLVASRERPRVASPREGRGAELRVVVQEAPDAVESIIANGVETTMGRVNARS
ncbi:MAG: hypothetical protein CM1200mP26_14640 [Acidimicrobiales bacterium]|nr:MAG: hypothetical protein CM1200mP26_14640 [Acidimicrobiales bacterium]